MYSIDNGAHRIYRWAMQKPTYQSMGLEKSVCPHCGTALRTYYCEDRLYMVVCPRCETMTLVRAKSPGDAAEKVSFHIEEKDKWDEAEGTAVWWNSDVDANFGDAPEYIGGLNDTRFPDDLTHFLYLPAADKK